MPSSYTNSLRLELQFTGENHWVLSPGHARIWYETVFAFLDHHVLGRPWRTPDLLQRRQRHRQRQRHRP